MIPEIPQSNDLFPISIIVTERNSKPAIELRATSTDPEIIKNIISCAFHKRPIIVNPTFRNDIKALSCLVDKGIIYRNEEENSYYFLF